MPFFVQPTQTGSNLGRVPKSPNGDNNNDAFVSVAGKEPSQLAKRRPVLFAARFLWRGAAARPHPTDRSRYSGSNYSRLETSCSSNMLCESHTSRAAYGLYLASAHV